MSACVLQQGSGGGGLTEHERQQMTSGALALLPIKHLPAGGSRTTANHPDSQNATHSPSRSHSPVDAVRPSVRLLTVYMQKTARGGSSGPG